MSPHRLNRENGVSEFLLLRRIPFERPSKKIRMSVGMKMIECSAGWLDAIMFRICLRGEAFARSNWWIRPNAKQQWPPSQSALQMVEWIEMMRLSLISDMESRSIHSQPDSSRFFLQIQRGNVSPSQRFWSFACRSMHAVPLQLNKIVRSTNDQCQDGLSSHTQYLCRWM